MNFIKNLFKNKQIPSGKIYLTEKELNILSQFDLLNKIFQHNFKRDYGNLTEEEKMLHNWFIISGQVTNGGFVQLFQNTKEDYIEEGKKAFKLLGNKKLQNIFDKAIKIYMKNKKLFLEDIKISDKTNLNLCKLDEKFFKIDDSIEKELYEYILSHKEKFMN